MCESESNFLPQNFLSGLRKSDLAKIRSEYSKIEISNFIPLNVKTWGGSPGLAVMGADSCTEGRGFECQHWMDIFSHIFAVKIVMFV